jgi:ubiquinone/menaquinone biosynthesis C-methylase UbiE
MAQVNPARPYYVGDMGRTYQIERLSVPEGMYMHVARVRAEKIAPYITPKMRILEYGVGLGYNLAALENRLKVGCDVDSMLSNFLRRHKILFRPCIDDIRNNRFDAVICHHVLEHVTDPWETLRELRRVVKPNGVVLLFVPFERERQYLTYRPDESNHHLFSWNPQTLGALATNAGFKVDKIGVQLFGYDRFAAIVANTVRVAAGYKLIRALLLLVRPRYEIAAILRK